MPAIELATGYVSVIPSAKGMLAGLTKELGAPVEQAAAQSGSRASAALAGRFSAGTRGLGKKFAVGLFAGTAVLATLGGGVLKLGGDFKTAYNSIRVETGATGKSFQGLKDDFKAVLSQRPENMQAVAEAVGKLHTGLDLTGKPLQEIAKSVLRLSSITKTDLGTNIDSVTHLLNNWGVATAAQPGKLDELLRASQSTGISVSDLASAMARMGSPLRQLGFSFEDSASLLGLLNKSGIDAASIMPALSKSIAAAAKQGKGAGDVFRDVFNQIRRAPTDTAAAGAAIKVFGARAGPNLAGLIRQGKLSYQALSASIAHGGDTIAKAAADTAGFSGKFKIFLNQMRVAVEPIAIATVTFAIKAMTAAGPYLTKFADIVKSATARVSAFFTANPSAKFVALAVVIGGPLLGAVVALATKLSFLISPASLVVIGIAALAAGAIYAYGHVAKFRAFVDRLGVSLRAFVTSAIPKVRAAFAAVVVFVQRLVDRLRQVDFGAIFARVVQVVAPVIGGLGRLGAAIVKIAIAALPVLVTGFRIGFAVAQRVIPPVIAALYVIARVAGVLVGGALRLAGVATSYLADHMAALKPLLLAVAGGFAAFKAGQAVVNVFKSISSAARSAVSGARSVLTAVTGAPAKIGAFFRSGTDTLRLKFLYTRDAVVKASSAIKSAVTTVASWGKQALRSALNTGRQVAAFVAQKVAAVAAAVASKALAAAQWLLNAAMDANPVTLIVIGIAALAAGVVLAYKHFAPFRAVVDAVGRALVTVAKVIGTVVVGAFNWLKSHWPLLLAILTGPIGLAVLAFKRFGPQILSGISTAFHAVVDFFTGLPAQILDALGNAGTWLLNIGGKIVGGLVTGLELALHLVFDFYVRLPIAILGKLAGAAVWLLQTGGKIIGGLLRGITNGTVAVVQFIGRIELRVLHALGAVASWLLGAGAKVIGGLLRGITTGAVAVWTFFTGLPGKVLARLGAVGTILVTKGVNLLLGLGNGIVTGAGKVLSWIGGLPGRILSALGNVGHILFEAGKHIIFGLIDGFKSVVGHVKDFLGNLTSSLTSWKGPQSKDRVLLHPVGALIIQGLIDGFASKLGAVKSKLREVTSAIANGVKIPKFAGLNDSDLSSFISSVTGQLPTASTAITDFATRAAAALGLLHVAIDKVAAARARLAADRAQHAGLARSLIDYKKLIDATGALAGARRASAAASDPAQFTKSLNAQNRQVSAFAADIKRLVGVHVPLLAKELAQAGPSALKLATAFARSPAKALAAERALERKARQQSSLEAMLTAAFGAKNTGIVTLPVGPGPKPPPAPAPFVPPPPLAPPPAAKSVTNLLPARPVDNVLETLVLELEFPAGSGLENATLRIPIDRTRKVQRAKQKIAAKQRARG